MLYLFALSAKSHIGASALLKKLRTANMIGQMQN